jgi:NDP-sugar pyrophosphorylase family protein
MDDEWSLAISKIADYPYQPLERLFRKNIPTFLIKNPNIVKAAKLIGYNMDGYWLDIHRHNIMQRPDGTIVITDPYA